jgi:putative hydrolase of the HAD superfamily
VTPRKHLVLDYGKVICRPQPPGAMERLAELAHLPVPELVQNYWLHRESYDRGGSARDYWVSVLGTTPDDHRLSRLVELDTASWLHFDPVVIRAIDAIHDAGTPVSLLSNAPHELARALRGHEVFSRFEQLWFSAELGMAKPDPLVFASVMSWLQAEPADVVFVDDRAENVMAAERLGIVALQYTGHDSLEAVRAATEC